MQHISSALTSLEASPCHPHSCHPTPILSIRGSWLQLCCNGWDGGLSQGTVTFPNDERQKGRGLREMCPGNTQFPRGTGWCRPAPRLKAHQHREGTAVRKVLTTLCAGTRLSMESVLFSHTHKLTLSTAESFAPVLFEVASAS